MTKWVRLWADMPTDPKWRVIARKSGRPISEVMAVFMFMMTNAGCSDDRGSLHNWDDEDIGAALDIDGECVTAIREAMQGKTLEGHKLSGWEKRQPEREDQSKERVRRFRERQAELAKRNVTQCNADVTQCDAPDTDTDTDTDNNLSVIKTASPPKTRRAKIRSQIAEDAQPTASDTSAAEAAGLTSAAFREQWSKFRNYHRAKGSLMADWQAAWRTWLGNMAEFQRQPRAGPPSYNNGKTGGFTLLKQAILENERAKSTQNNGLNPAVQLLPVNGTAKPGTSVGYDDGLPDSSGRLFGN
jgi:hypothetical protein